MTVHNDFTDKTIVQRRSEIIFLFDANDCNPNGDPLSASNRPRIDKQTGQAIITDVRLKRYLRDQLEEDDQPVYIKSPSSGDADTRDDLIVDVVNADDELEDLLREINNPDDPDDKYGDVGEQIVDVLLENAVDIRYFGATMSLKGDDGIEEVVNENVERNFTGPVQFLPARSLNPVFENENYNSLTSVIGTKDGKEQGGFALDDHRIKYGLFPFYGVINENGADETHLTEADVERLDSLCWRAVKNQTITRSKVGQQPRLYLRVEYEEDNFQIGNLHQYLTMDEERSDNPEEMRSINDIVVNASQLFEVIERNREKIHRLHVRADPLLTFSDGDEVYQGTEIVDELESRFGTDTVEQVDIYNSEK